MRETPPVPMQLQIQEMILKNQNQGFNSTESLLMAIAIDAFCMGKDAAYENVLKLVREAK